MTRYLSILEDEEVPWVLLELGYTHICYECDGTGMVPKLSEERFLGIIPVIRMELCPCCKNELRIGCHEYFSPN